MPISVKAAVHGVVDPTFASNAAVAQVAPVSAAWTEEERAKIVGIRDVFDARLKAEVNRIEGALSLMLSHVEGELQSKIEMLKVRKVYIPFAVGIVFGALFGFFVR